MSNGFFRFVSRLYFVIFCSSFCKVRVVWLVHAIYPCVGGARGSCVGAGFGVAGGFAFG